LFSVPVLVEEKVDGSQFSFFKTAQGDMQFCSKGAEINAVAPPEMFKAGVSAVLSVESRIPASVTFRGEYLAKPKHNVLCYGRVPANHVAVFDIERGGGFLSPEEKRALAADLGFETVPTLFQGIVDNPQDLRAFLERESFLSGPRIEGVVIKPAAYNLYGPDKKVLFGKFVSEVFKEAHKKEWKSPESSKDILTQLAEAICTPARWDKAVMHLREAGKIEDSLKDIGPLIKEVQADTTKEEADFIKQKLYEWAWPQLRRNILKGFPEWYKERLLQKQFESPEACVEPKTVL
jgi:hypothetical protein